MKNVYLDSASNTSLDKKVFRAMKPYLSSSFCGNSQSTHDYGVNASIAISNARELIANYTGFLTKEIYFTSGATESNNWVLKSLALHELYYEPTKKKHIVVSSIEHASVLRCCQQLEKMGFTITYVEPNEAGIITVKNVKKALRFDTLLVCVMAVNNETGVQNPVNSIGKIVHQNKSLMMSDCTQYLSYGDGYCRLKDKMPFVDYFTFSAHKIYGPTGVGCLIARSRAPLYPLLIGGGQENGMRGGTSNTAGIVGMAEAYKLMAQTSYEPHFVMLYDYLLEQLGKKSIPFKLNATPTHKNIISLNLSYFMRDSDLASLFANYGIAVSAGSACEAVSDAIESKPSHVLKALHLPDYEIHNTIRVSFSKHTTKKDIDALVRVIETLYIKAKEI